MVDKNSWFEKESVTNRPDMPVTGKKVVAWDVAVPEKHIYQGIGVRIECDDIEKFKKLVNVLEGNYEPVINFIINTNIDSSSAKLSSDFASEIMDRIKMRMGGR